MTPDELRRFQERMGWTGAKCARMLGVSPVTWSRWVCGEHEPPPFLAMALRWLQWEKREGRI